MSPAVFSIPLEYPTLGEQPPEGAMPPEPQLASLAEAEEGEPRGCVPPARCRSSAPGGAVHATQNVSLGLQMLRCWGF